MSSISSTTVSDRPLTSRAGGLTSGLTAVRLEALAFWAVSVLVGLLIVPPLLAMVMTSFTRSEGIMGAGAFTLENYVRVAGVFAQGGPLVNSLLYAGGSAFVSILLGGLLAWLVERTNTPLRSIGYFICFSVLAIPPIVYSVAWVLLFGKGGPVNGLLRTIGLGNVEANIFTLPGMIFVESLSWIPLAFLLTAASMRMMDPSLEEAAAVSGASLWHTVRRVSAPLIMPSLLATLLLVFVRTVEAFAAPALIGLPGKITVLTTEVYLSTTSFPPDYGMASTYGTSLVLLVAGFLFLYARLTRGAHRFQTITGKGYRPRLLDLGPLRFLGSALLLLYLLVLVILPFGILLWGSLQPFYTHPALAGLSRLTLKHYVAILNYDKVTDALINSVLIGAVSATLAVAITLLAAWLLIRTQIRFRGLLDLLISIPLVVPGIVLGIAVLRLYAPLPLPIYGTLVIFVLAYVPRFLPYAMRYSHAGLLQLHRELEEAAALSGATHVVTFRRVVLPLLTPSLAAAWIFVFLLAVKELAASILLVGPRTPVIAVALYDLWRDGQVTEMAAFSMLLLLVFGSITIAVYVLARGKGLEVS
jgi:iron(III) transport system permease protein